MSLGHILAHLFSMSHVTEPHISALVFNVSGTKLYSFYFYFFFCDHCAGPHHAALLHCCRATKLHSLSHQTLLSCLSDTKNPPSFSYFIHYSGIKKNLKKNVAFRSFCTQLNSLGPVIKHFLPRVYFGQIFSTAASVYSLEGGGCTYCVSGWLRCTL